MSGSKFKRWRFEDPTPRTGQDTYYDFPTNPNEMTSPHGSRNISVRSSTAIDGQPLFFEGPRAPAQWQFSGNCPTADQYEQMRSWVYDRLGRRVYVHDHFGRRLTVVLQSFDPAPRRDINRYWHHTYSCIALVIKVGEPTVGEVWR